MIPTSWRQSRENQLWTATAAVLQQIRNNIATCRRVLVRCFSGRWSSYWSPDICLICSCSYLTELDGGISWAFPHLELLPWQQPPFMLAAASLLTLAGSDQPVLCPPLLPTARTGHGNATKLAQMVCYIFDLLCFSQGPLLSSLHHFLLCVGQSLTPSAL